MDIYLFHVSENIVLHFCNIFSFYDSKFQFDRLQFLIIKLLINTFFNLHSKLIQ